MAYRPDFVFCNASALNNKLKSAFCRTPPWQVMQFLLRIGLTWELKSTAFWRVLNVNIVITAASVIITNNIFLEKIDKAIWDLIRIKLIIICCLELTLRSDHRGPAGNKEIFARICQAGLRIDLMYI
jgi:hypothetical protein